MIRIMHDVAVHDCLIVGWSVGHNSPWSNVPVMRWLYRKRGEKTWEAVDETPDRSRTILVAFEHVGDHGVIVGNGYKELAQYNAERARGVMHTPEWDARMAQIQERFIRENQVEVYGQ